MPLNRAIAVFGEIRRCLGNDASQLYVSDFEQLTRRQFPYNNLWQVVPVEERFPSVDIPAFDSTLGHYQCKLCPEEDALGQQA